MNLKFQTKRLYLIVSVAILIIAVFLYAGPVSQQSSQSDTEVVESVARDYIEGWYNGDENRMRSSLHDELVKRMPVMDDSSQTIQLRQVSKARMVELTAGGGGENPDAFVQIDVYDVSTNIASAVVLSPDYLDYMHLAKTHDGWKIVNILFHARK